MHHFMNKGVEYVAHILKDKKINVINMKHLYSSKMILRIVLDLFSCFFHII